MDIMTIASPDVIQNVQDMLELALACCDRPPKQIAYDVGYSADSIRAALRGTRNIPLKARQKLSSINFIAAAAVALEATGFNKLFGYQKVDRHIQPMILRLRKQDKELVYILDDLPVLLLDKNIREDLSDSEFEEVEMATRKLVDRANSTINLIMELEVRYKLGLSNYLQGKEKTPALQSRRLTN
ncbi:hypothetical protein [Pelosinus sp. IPA-1]|uniref:hypothetical protein n=1 Tax=Pelosinus sp. IPA-1 TaxID=3029569 RepID=UPI002436259D|nr:hypothetical protein [Pelosinus sp. IPA-1]GMB01049.1 hypothetical protein PIPA1_38480 [Pelosinus sp. IPA-1]